MLIRPGADTDRPALRTLFLNTRRASWAWLQGENWRLEDFDAVTQDEQIWVAEIDGQLAGFAAVWTRDNFLHHLFVSPDWQGHGVGSALLDKVQSELTDTGSLKCLVQNARALRFYQRHGWRTTARGTSPDGEYWLMHYPVL
ncbi:GNAT family N-acetyltransferase [[Enterobacter] lignolyticus]|uniref:GCN5-related N-acetyltransferase n=1 Tax=Enterobacter lignolyticus (strain SCF1) TaxID=701347 RepID=E3GC50_ENTLS|nr:GNAT family N-acetyltransferase [[Enterobacter] lignolyticus]ADO47844.1 GCN5-related N-acetyltransferase [[Enterobacter] lignolyticus SCF1]